jgi:chromosome segregation ATPase
MKSEIAVTRRTTYRAEAAVTKLEKDKKDQDKLIDHMNEQIKKLNEQKALYTAQLTAQQEETLAAQQTLKEAAIEMDKIQASKKTLLEDWQKALEGMKRRDRALQAINDELKNLDNSLCQLKSESVGLGKEIDREADSDFN